MKIQYEIAEFVLQFDLISCRLLRFSLRLSSNNTPLSYGWNSKTRIRKNHCYSEKILTQYSLGKMIFKIKNIFQC